MGPSLILLFSAVNSQPDSSSVLGGGLFSGLGGLGAKGPTIATANPFGTPLSNVGPGNLLVNWI